MKSLFFALSLLFVFASCQKEITGEIINSGTNDTSTTPATGAGKMKAKINGVQWVADKGAGASFSTAGNGLPRLLNITGVNVANTALTITLTDSGVHTYMLSDYVMNAAGLLEGTSGANVLATNQGPAGVVAGSVSVTSIDTIKKTVTGSFSFKVYRQIDNTEKTITEGSFTDLPYVDGSNVMPPAASTDTFTVKINDTLFKPFHISGVAVPVVNSINVEASDSLVLKNAGLTFPADIKPGSYTLDFLGATYIGQYNYGGNYLGSSSGTLEILEHNTSTKRIRGKFNFVADTFTSSAKANFTEGFFSVKYQ